jgi:hypothetical protein
MVRPGRANLAQTAPLDELLSIVLRQFKRPLAALGVELTSPDVQAIVTAIADRQPLSEKALAVRGGLVTLVEESLAVLAGWNLTLATALETDMDAMPGWESTAEFLEVANTKSNAEIRIAGGVSLVAALGDLRFADEMLYLATHDDGEIETVVARRVLLFLSGVDPDAPDWAAQVQAWRVAQG